MEKNVRLGRPKKSEDEKRSTRQNFRTNKKEDCILKQVPGKGPTQKWCYLLMFWVEKKSETR